MALLLFPLRWFSRLHILRASQRLCCRRCRASLVWLRLHSGVSLGYDEEPGEGGLPSCRCGCNVVRGEGMLVTFVGRFFTL